MWTILIMSMGIMVLPAYVGVIHFGTGIYPVWVFFTVYVCLTGFVFRWRYAQGKWKEMRVIERPSAPATFE